MSGNLAANVVGGMSAPLGGSTDLAANVLGGNSAPLGGEVQAAVSSSLPSMLAKAIGGAMQATVAQAAVM